MRVIKKKGILKIYAKFVLCSALVGIASFGSNALAIKLIFSEWPSKAYGVLILFAVILPVFLMILELFLFIPKIRKLCRDKALFHSAMLICITIVFELAPWMVVILNR